MEYERYRKFRQQTYQMLGKAKDATFELVEIEDFKLGKLKISKWDNLHFRSAADYDLSLIQVQKIDSKGYPQKCRPLWLIWGGHGF